MRWFYKSNDAFWVVNRNTASVFLGFHIHLWFDVLFLCGRADAVVSREALFSCYRPAWRSLKSNQVRLHVLFSVSIWVWCIQHVTQLGLNDVISSESVMNDVILTSAQTSGLSVGLPTYLPEPQIQHLERWFAALIWWRNHNINISIVIWKQIIAIHWKENWNCIL